MAEEIKVALEEECKVDVDILHDTLLKLPAEKYLDLYKRMYAKIYRFPLFSGSENEIESWHKTIENTSLE